MQKSFNLLLTLLFSFTSVMSALAQAEVEYKDVILDGRPAKLNVDTGEITLVKHEDKLDVKTKADSVAVHPKLITDRSVISASNTTEVDDETSDYHIVKAGENLFKLSVKYKTSLTALKKANNLETTLIRTGQKLRVRNFDAISENPSLYIVKRGDNLYRIALKNGTTVKALKSLNGLKSNIIQIGQKLQLN